MRRLSELVRLARARGLQPEDGVMRFYRALLRLYPASFRAEYRDELCHAFAERTREHLRTLRLDRRSSWRRSRT